MSKIVIIGAGAMGSAFALPCLDNNHDINIVGTHLENDFIDDLKKNDNLHQGLKTKIPKEINIFKFEKFDEILKSNIDLVVLNDDLLKNRVKDLNEASKYRNVFQFKELTLNFHFACSLNTEQKIVDSLINSMKVLEKRGVFLGIRNKWKKNMVSLIN